LSQFDETFDFVVVGSGGGSMCAGLYLRQKGKSVLILEKTDLVGGTTARSGGVMWVPNNRFMKRDGIEDSIEKATTYLEGLIPDSNDTPGATRERWHAYLTEAPRMIDFIVDQGVRLTRAAYWPDYYDERPGGVKEGRTVIEELFDANELGAWRDKLRPGYMPYAARVDEALIMSTYKRTWAGKKMFAKVALRTALAKITGARWQSCGASLQGQMLKANLKAGVDLRTDSPVRELIIENGAARGVVTVKDGKPWRVAARMGVLVNAGGFAHNQRMRDRYQPGTVADWSAAGPGDTGEMIEEMMRHGAAIGQMNTMIGFQFTIPPGHEDDIVKPGMQSVTAAPHAMLVDRTGVRYMNEGGSYMAYCAGMLERNKTVPAIPGWAIVDSYCVANYFVANTMPGSKKPQHWYDEGYLHKADTIEELAKKIDVDPATLRATVDRFNGFAAKGRDEDFHRDERAYDIWLGDPSHTRDEGLSPVDQPPYYALPVMPGDVSTFGGVVTDEHARVVKTDGSIIPGLYATGVSTASMLGRIYPGAGGSVGPSLTWGFIAAQHAAGERA